jgi:hypothetical protein
MSRAGLTINVEQLVMELPIRDRAHGRALAAQVAARLRDMPPPRAPGGSMYVGNLRVDLPYLRPGASDAEVVDATVRGIHGALLRALGSGAETSPARQAKAATTTTMGGGPDGAGPSSGSGADDRAGAPLDRAARAAFEERLGQDFGDVRVHTGGEASALAAERGAAAVSVGDDIFFRTGRFQPETQEGRRLLAHELTHVAQRRQGGAPAPRAALEAEADAVAASVASGQSARVQHTAAPRMALFDNDDDKKKKDEHAPTKNDSPLPGFSQGDFNTCGAASLVTALITWDREKRDPNGPSQLVVEACNLVLIDLIHRKSRLINAWNAAHLRGGITGEKLWDDLNDALVAIRDKARVPGVKLTESDYLDLSASFYLIYNDKTRAHAGLEPTEVAKLVSTLGLGGGNTESAATLDDLLAGPTVTGLKPGQVAQISWFGATAPDQTGNRQLTPHIFLLGRLKSGDWFISDQGTNPPFELTTQTLESLKGALKIAMASGKTRISPVPPAADLMHPLPAGVRVLGDPSQVDKTAIETVLKPGEFLAEVDAGLLTIGDKVFAWDFVTRTYDLDSAKAALPPGDHGGVIVELPAGVFNLYKTNMVKQDNVDVPGIDVSDSERGKLSPASHLYFHAWLLLAGPKGRRKDPLKVY